MKVGIFYGLAWFKEEVLMIIVLSLLKQQLK